MAQRFYKHVPALGWLASKDPGCSYFCLHHVEILQACASTLNVGFGTLTWTLTLAWVTLYQPNIFLTLYPLTVSPNSSEVLSMGFK